MSRLTPPMLDSTLRPISGRLLGPIAHGPAARLHPIAWSTLSLAASIGAAAAAWRGAVAVSVAAWLVGRLLDGIDGAVARSTGRQSDLGGLLDFLGDSIAYAIVPIGIAAGVDDRATWIATAVVIATFYVNAVSLGYTAALLEKRALGASQRGEPTSATLPRGLVEGTETIVVFTLALALPDSADVIWTVMAIAVALTIVERTIWASRSLRTVTPTTTTSTPTSAAPPTHEEIV